MRKVLGVSLGKGAVETAVAESRLGAVRAVRAARTVATGGGEERTELLKKWSQEYRPYGVVIGLPLRHYSHHLIEMPAMGRADMRRALSFDLEKYLPLPVDDYVFDFISMPREKGLVKVLVLAVRRDLIDGLVSLTQGAGLRLLAVRCCSAEIFCGVLQSSGKRRYGGVIVNTTDESHEVMGVVDSRLSYLKNFPRGVDLAGEIERLAALYPGEVTFTGDIDEVTVARLRGKKVDLPLAYLLARSALKKGCIAVNFLPAGLSAPARDFYPQIIGGLAAAAVVLFLATGITAYIKEVRTLDGIEARLGVLRRQAADVLDARKKLEGLSVDRRTVLDFTGRSNIATRALTDLSDILPKDTWLINVSADERGRVEIEGLTMKTSAVVNALEKSARFKNVAFSAPIISRENEERFALKMEVAGR